MKEDKINRVNAKRAYEAKRKHRIERFEILAKAYLSKASSLMDTDPITAAKHEEKAIYWEYRIKTMEDNKAIASSNPEVRDELNAKIAYLQNLAAQKKKMNAELRMGGHPVTFSESDFTNLRGKIQHCKRRLAKLSNIKKFQPFEVGDIRVAIKDGTRIEVALKRELTDIVREQLKTLGLKWSSYSKKWVRMYTGQDQKYFVELRKVLEKAKE